MAISIPRLHGLGRSVLVLVNSLVGLAVLVVGAIIWLEAGWAVPDLSATPEQAFRRGTIGTELTPLAVAKVLPDLDVAKKHFQQLRPDGSKCEDWVECFGFIPTKDSPLPVGFAVTHYRPRSAAPSPHPFVGFSCALCHTTRLRLRGDREIDVEGPGSSSLNLFAWLDAFQAALLDRVEPGPGKSVDPADPQPYKITVGMIAAKYQETGEPTLGIFDRIMIWLWLGQFRAVLEAGLPGFDDPYGNGHSRSSPDDPRFC